MYGNVDAKTLNNRLQVSKSKYKLGITWVFNDAKKRPCSTIYSEKNSIVADWMMDLTMFSEELFAGFGRLDHPTHEVGRVHG